ncbi:MAG TPA: hypothetical protein VFF11_16365, partial [Candidatus Binatia bacterium]|nr:hypothetical protein [Candidatus Binatia bacterium]
KSDRRQDSQVQENLYVVSGHAGHPDQELALHRRFAALVPQLKASDFDYIIFDFPPVTVTSITSRLARFMDITLLVVESEKADRDVVQQACDWLRESGAEISLVLNKMRSYVPKSLHQEFHINT